MNRMQENKQMTDQLSNDKKKKFRKTKKINVIAK